MKWLTYSDEILLNKSPKMFISNNLGVLPVLCWYSFLESPVNVLTDPVIGSFYYISGSNSNEGAHKIY